VETTTQATSAAAVSTVQAASAISNVVASTTGTCQGASNPCTGDATYYDVDASEYTSCGDQVDGLTTNIVAIAADFMGAQSNGNPMCGKTISVSYKGTTIQATVCDKCPGCTGRGIDLSRAAFQSIASFDIGRIKSGDITWWFN
jgi:expansin (peptidoglycan-binding protein)